MTETRYIKGFLIWALLFFVCASLADAKGWRTSSSRNRNPPTAEEIAAAAARQQKWDDAISRTPKLVLDEIEASHDRFIQMRTEMEELREKLTAAETEAYMKHSTLMLFIVGASLFVLGFILGAVSSNQRGDDR